MIRSTINGFVQLLRYLILAATIICSTTLIAMSASERILAGKPRSITASKITMILALTPLVP